MAKIIVDSGCDTNCEEMKNINLDVVPLNLLIDDKHFTDNSSLDLDMYMREMKNCKTVPRSSAPSSEKYLNSYLNTKEDTIFVVTIASKLSASYNSAVLAKNTYLENSDNPKKFIYIFDSIRASSGESLIVFKINELLNKNLKNEEIVEEVNKYIKSLNTFFILESYNNLVKNGRINPYVAKLASMLSIKPICKSYDGTPKIFLKARGLNNAIHKLVDHIASESIDYKNRLLAITHVNAEETANYIKEKIKEKMNFKNIIILKPTGLVTTYADEKGIVLSY